MVLFQKLQAWQDGPDGLDDQELADALGVHRTTIQRAKRGERVLGMRLQLALQTITKIPPSEWADFFAQTVHLRGERASVREKKTKLVGALVDEAA